ncbi:restriction endonuclease [Superficieibacter sp. HKU1]|uniref:restriction endonuclease n=1 Tax=Superficieibacter sp. HKU1 TaxID=3031919 RepID=UPI0023E282BC|nr:restriction endonuclease [Superficieibacter sp. HKU1]WES68579.1 restriction endonuclease [Superficieibacter sp. HKU1]
MNIFQNMTPDDWENFAAYYLENIGYTILEGASVGPDRGKDLIAEKESVRSLVSCKNNVRSNKSVTLADEDSILDRMSQHKTELFIGFYSTRAGDNLKKYLNSSNIPHTIIESYEILKNLKSLPFMVNQSFFDSGRITQPKLFGAEYEPLLCCCGCSKDLLDSDKIENAKCYLFENNNDLTLEWYLDDHSTNHECIRQLSIKKFLYLRELNATISEIEDSIDAQKYNITAQFDEALTTLLELSHQMIYPSGWAIG